MLRKILEVFTRKYKEETEYREFLEKSLSKMRLRTNGFDVEESVSRLADRGFKSNFKMDMGVIMQ